jgi:hypothetical protein
VDQRDSKAHRFDRCLAGGNPLAPDLLSPEERLSEVAQILAAGLVRLRQRECGDNCSRLERNRLDFSPARSVHATTAKRRKVA